MKQLFPFLVLLSGALWISSCLKETPVAEEPCPSDQTVRTFTCRMAEADSKVAVDAAGKTVWEAGDQILVHGEGASNRVVVTLGAQDIGPDGKTATIRCKGLEGTVFYASYPAGACAEGDLSCYSRFRSTNHFLMAAREKDGEFRFYNLCGLIRFSVAGSFDNYVFSGNGGEAVSYDVFQSRVRADGIDYLYTGGGVDPVPAITVTGDVAADGNTVHYVCLPAGTSFTKGFTFTFFSGDTPVSRASTNTPVDVAAGRILVLGDISGKLEDYSPSAQTLSPERVQPIYVTANQVSKNEQYYGNGSANLLIDGSYETYYHSPWPGESWSGGTGTVFPVVWEFGFDGSHRVSYLGIMHRGQDWYGEFQAGGHPRGQIGRFRVWCKSVGSASYALVGEYDFGGKGGYDTAMFPEPLEHPAAIKLEILDGDPGCGTENPYIATAEVEFFDSNRADVNAWIDRIFTDRSCSELRSGVTREDISQLGVVCPYLAVNVALPLLNGTYPQAEREFRIHDYEAYSDNRLARQLATQYYSSLNNPTGIEVHAGESLLVCLDQVPDGHSVGLAVYGDSSDGTQPNYGGGGDADAPDQYLSLSPGINEMSITADGMAYVMNTAASLTAASPSVRVHILPGCGTVQGYFDPSRHSDSRYAQLLAACTYKYFMVKGEKCLFLFHTSQLLADYPSSIRSGIGVWDDIVRWEHELMGLDLHPEFNNHMLAISTTASGTYMDASSRRVRFNTGAIAKIGSRERMMEAADNIWGPAHEMGHVNQMAINWRSTTESSNNLFSNYCLKQLFAGSYYSSVWSRGKKVTDLADDYAEGKPWALLGDGSYQGEDPELHMRMNWQLWNYFHNCGAMPDFFPRLFEYFRNGHALPNPNAAWFGRSEDNGLAQLEYYEACCAVSGLDLTEFFDAWGFFRPIDVEYSQYGTAQYTVTEAMIAASKARVAAMNLPKAPPIHFLEDRSECKENMGGYSVTVTYSKMGYWTLFRDKPTISGTLDGVYYPASNAVILNPYSTWGTGPVGVEVRQGTSATGTLMYFSNMYYFKLPSALSSLDGYTVWAVQADGKRVKVEMSNW